MIVKSMRKIKAEEQVPYMDQCEATGLAYSSSNRWRYRLDNGLEPVMAPGPKKVQPLDLAGLEKRITILRHGLKRTAGTGELFAEFKSQISRRDLRGMVTGARIELNHRRRDAQYKIRWCKPGIVWAMDDTEDKHDNLGEKVHIHSIRDLGSKYTFDPLLDLKLAKGRDVAKNLDDLFKKCGAPLFIKRDNGSNLNHGDVDEVLAEHMVIPVNSPPYYPQYNGGIEKSQYEIKQELKYGMHDTLRESKLSVRLGAHDLNHRRRRSLSWQTPCQSFWGPDNIARKFTKRKRKEVYDVLTAASAALIEVTEGECAVDNAWRLAVETWLLEHGFITMSKKRKCYPILCKLFAHH